MTPSPITSDEQQAIRRIADAVQWGTPEMAVGVLRRHVETLQRVERERVASEFFSREDRTHSFVVRYGMDGAELAKVLNSQKPNL